MKELSFLLECRGEMTGLLPGRQGENATVDLLLLQLKRFIFLLQ